MTQLNNYPLEFVERTIDLISKLSTPAKQHDLDVTFLLNCTLGLIVATSENIETCKSGYFNKKIAELDTEEIFPKKIAYLNFKNDFKSLKEKINKTSLSSFGQKKFSVTTQINIEGYNQARNITLKKFLKKIRNGVAHQNIMPINQDLRWKGVRIWNYNRYEVKDFEVEFKISELKRFSIFLAKQYVKEFQKNEDVI